MIVGWLVGTIGNVDEMPRFYRGVFLGTKGNVSVFSPQIPGTYRADQNPNTPIHYTPTPTHM